MVGKETLETNATEVDPLSDQGLEVGSPENDASTGDEGSPEGAQSDPVDGQQRDVVTPDFGGLPFKEISELVNAHKSLQGSYTKSRQELFNLQRQMEQITPILRQWQAEKQKAQTPQEKVDIPKFLETFIEKGPDALTPLIEKMVEARLGNFQGQLLSPIQQELNQIRTNSSVDKFMATHPEVTDADEDAIIEIMQENPWLEQIQSLPNRLEMAYNMLLRKEPQRFASRNANSAALNDMKSAASNVGTKSGSRGRVGKDEFDDVLSVAGKGRYGV